jgi:hypothetical protein
LTDGVEEYLKQKGVFVEPRLNDQAKASLLGLFEITRGDNFDIKVLAKEASKQINKNIAMAMFNIGKGSKRSMEILCDRMGISVQKRMITEIFELCQDRPCNLNEVTLRLGLARDSSGYIESIFTVIILSARLKLDILNKINQAIKKGEELQFEEET